MRIIPFVAILALALTGCTMDYYDEEPQAQDAYYDDEYGADDGELVFDEFEELEYWGQWFSLPPFGWIWRPTVVMEWRPYDHGHWLWSDYGWTWSSYEPFGWVTYHYGFWTYDVVWGWIWVPGYEWYPARVNWVTFDDGYIAWAPIPPPGYEWYNDPWIVDEVYAWHVVDDEHFTETEVGRHHRQFKERYHVKDRSSVLYKAPDQSSRGTLQPVTIELAEFEVRGRTLQRMRLPDDESERMVRYREETTEKIRRAGDADRDPQVKVPYQDDRVTPVRERVRDDNRKRERPKKPETRKPESRKKRVEKKKKDGADKPIKQEPDKKKNGEKEEPKKEREKTKKKRNG